MERILNVKKINLTVCVIVLLLMLSCKIEKVAPIIYETETLKIERLSEKTYVQSSYLESKNFGKVSCNGMIFIDKGEAIIFDSPTLDSVSAELINYVEKELKSKVKAVVVNHFHVDCLGGLGEFHEREIPSYASELTIALAQKNNEVVPLNGFDKMLELKVGEEVVKNEYLGEGHTKDNIVSYLPSEKILFGGCLIKSKDAGKGNLKDANVDAWASTVKKVRDKYPDLKRVIPGHGKTGDRDLLDYTITLFEK